ncbi:acyltransferase domain-containing protein [Chitinophagaceae bacterium MMS25-I14]
MKMVCLNNIGIRNISVNKGSEKELKQFWSDCVNNVYATFHHRDAKELLPLVFLQQQWAEVPEDGVIQLYFIHSASGVTHPGVETDTQHFYGRLHTALLDLQVQRAECLRVQSATEIADNQYECISIEFGRKQAHDDNAFYADIATCVLSDIAAMTTDPFYTDNLHEWTFANECRDAFESLAHTMRPAGSLSEQCALSAQACSNLVHEWLTSIARAALALHHRTIPWGNKYEEAPLPGGYIQYDNPTPWIFRPFERPTASCFALHETHCLAIQLQELPGSVKAKLYDTRADLFTFSAQQKEDMIPVLTDFARKAETLEYDEVLQLATTINLGQAHAHRAAIVASGKEDLLEKLKKTIKGIGKSDRSSSRIKNNTVWNISGEQNPRIAGVFPGQGAQHQHMLKALCMRFPQVRNWFDHLDASLVSVNGILPSLSVFPPSGGLSEADRKTLLDNLYSQEGGSVAVIVSSIALSELLHSFGCRADLLVGHSSGEISAMLTSRMLRFDTKEQLFETILSINQKGAQGDSRGEIPKGKFLAVTVADEHILNAFISRHPDDVFLAMDNCPQQKVLFFPNERFEELHAELVSLNAICMLLYFDRAYHTALFEVEMPSIRAIYDSFDFYQPQIPIFNCITLDTFPDDAPTIREWAALNWTHCVRFREACRQLSEKEGINIFLEMGPGGTLSGFTDNTLNQVPHKALVMEQEGQDAYVQLLNVLANLFVEGVDVQLNGLYDSKPAATKVQDSAEEISTAPLPDMMAAEPDVQPAVSPNQNHQMFSGTDVRSAIAQEHFAMMNDFLESETRILASVLARRTTSPGSRPQRQVPVRPTQPAVQPVVPGMAPVQLPMIGRIVSGDENSCVCERIISRDTDLFLQHHTFGRFILKQPKGTTPLPVVPLAMIIEMMAEAATVAAPGHVVSEIINLSAMRWMTVDDASLTIHIDTRRISKPEDADVRLMVTVIQKDAPNRPYCKAMVVLRRNFAPPPTPMTITASVPSDPLWDAESFFEQCLFHGDAFSSIDELMRIGDHEIEVRLNVPNKDMLFTGDATPAFLTPAQLLDVPGHVTAYWQVEHGDEYFGIFPISIDRLQFYAPPAAPGTRLIARAGNTIQDTIITTEFEMLTPEESVVMKISGFKMIYYKLEASLLKAHYWTGPNTYFCNDMIIADADMIGFEANTIKGGFQEQGSGIWLSSLLHMYCNENERQYWSSLPEKGKRRTEWLLGRIAAKEIVRKWASFNHCLYILCPDIKICYDTEGRPFAVCEELEQAGIVPDISLAHSNMQAVAIAAKPGWRAGVDAEYLSGNAKEDQHLEIAFDAAELKLVHDSGTSLRAFVCAKEAAGKAIGTGILGSLGMWKVTGYTDDTVTVSILETTITVTVAHAKDQVIAWCKVAEDTAFRIKEEILTRLHIKTIKENDN